MQRDKCIVVQSVIYDTKKKDESNRVVPQTTVFIVKIPNEFPTCLPKIFADCLKHLEHPVLAMFSSCSSEISKLDYSETRPCEKLCVQNSSADRLSIGVISGVYVLCEAAISSRKYL